MRYKRYSLECSKFYAAKVMIYPDTANDFHFTLHWHKDYELLYVERGTLTINRVNDNIELSEGDLYFLNSEEVHSYANLTKDSRFIVVSLPLKAILPYMDEPQKSPKFSIKGEQTRIEIARSLKSLGQFNDFEDRLTSLKIKSILNNILYYLIKDCQTPELTFVKGSDCEDYECAKSAIIYMHNNYKNDISLSEIAGYVGMAPAHFSKYFKDKTGITFLKYLRQIRLEYAIVELCENDISVKTAAEHNGFPNVNSFILICKSEYGKTPLEMKTFAKT